MDQRAGWKYWRIRYGGFDMNEPKSWWEIMEREKEILEARARASKDEPTLLEMLGEDKYEKLRQMSMDDDSNDPDDN
tara:strand:- start:1318 stop:1548 length:231 start_codon:yes stop_codon:yes gene_type:complete